MYQLALSPEETESKYSESLSSMDSWDNSIAHLLGHDPPHFPSPSFNPSRASPWDLLALSSSTSTSTSTSARTSEDYPQAARTLDTCAQHLALPIPSPYISRAKNGPPATARVGPDDFDTLRVLGKGAYGKVYLVRHKRDGELYAMKVLKKASIMGVKKDTEHIKAERSILEEACHPFIVKLCFAFQTEQYLYLVMEYACGGELFTHMEKEGKFSERVAAFYIAELVLALEHLHNRGIIYRDLKPENCMLDREGHILITDFGLSKVAAGEDGRASTVCGTVEYMAPEMLLQVDYDRTVDVWSLGIMLYDMLTGSPPFTSYNRKRTMEAILNNKLRLPWHLSADAKDLITLLLRKNPNMRLGSGPEGISALKSHRFFRHIDWRALEAKEVTPPIIPHVTRPELAENFQKLSLANSSLASSKSRPSPASPTLAASYLNHTPATGALKIPASKVGLKLKLRQEDSLCGCSACWRNQGSFCVACGRSSSAVGSMGANGMFEGFSYVAKELIL
ncbi:uncharacterized protein VTP21DRAFT_3107 [Calcarisporiella thermophila]|uniref:uncharacterized protein n=1 Tax=Calcarisporiella thermophila TaxID=911321 RepID=UPI0037435DC5